MLSDSERRRFDAITGDLSFDEDAAPPRRLTHRVSSIAGQPGPPRFGSIAWAEARFDARLRNIRGNCA